LADSYIHSHLKLQQFLNCFLFSAGYISSPAITFYSRIKRSVFIMMFRSYSLRVLALFAALAGQFFSNIATASQQQQTMQQGGAPTTASTGRRRVAQAQPPAPYQGYESLGRWSADVEQAITRYEFALEQAATADQARNDFPGFVRHMYQLFAQAPIPYSRSSTSPWHLQGFTSHQADLRTISVNLHDLPEVKYWWGALYNKLHRDWHYHSQLLAQDAYEAEMRAHSAALQARHDDAKPRPGCSKPLDANALAWTPSSQSNRSNTTSPAAIDPQQQQVDDAAVGGGGGAASTERASISPSWADHLRNSGSCTPTTPTPTLAQDGARDVLFVGVGIGAEVRVTMCDCRPEIDFLCQRLEGVFARPFCRITMSGLFEVSGANLDLLRSTAEATQGALAARGNCAAGKVLGADQRQGITCVGGVDATQLKTAFPQRKFLHIVWVGPAAHSENRAGVLSPDQCREANLQLITAFVNSAAEVLLPGGTIHLIQNFGNAIFPTIDQIRQRLGNSRYTVTDKGVITLRGRVANDGTDLANRTDRHLTVLPVQIQTAIICASPLPIVAAPIARRVAAVGLTFALGASTPALVDDDDDGDDIRRQEARRTTQAQWEAIRNQSQQEQ
jgi:hypothetical protein